MSVNLDKEVVQEGRKNTFEGEVPEAPLRDRIPKKLAKKLKEKNVAGQVTEMWRLANSNRAEWLRTQEKLLNEFEEFIRPIREGAYAWSSTMHMPVTFTVCRTFHSRMLGALLGFDPPFTVAARQSANAERAPLVQEFLRYTLKDWANEYKGVEAILDSWVWNWISSGRGILKYRWERKYSRFEDVVQVPRPGPMQYMIDEAGNEVAVPTTVMEEQEQEVIVPCFIGPRIEIIHNEDLAIIGGDGDPDEADAVIHQQFLTAGELWQLADQGIFDADAVRAVIEAGPDRRSSDATGSIKQARHEIALLGELDPTEEEDRYRVLEAYIKKDVYGSGIPEDVVIWVADTSKQQLRATYLRRASHTGTRPFAVADFHRRTNTANPIGLVELMYTLQHELDTIHNMRVDFGLLSTLPFGFYRASSSMATERIPLEPGAMIPMDNPTSDVYFPNLGNRTSFGFQEESALYTYIERMTSISDLSLGILNNQGAARTATGARITSNENNANLDVYLKRLNRGFKKMLKGVFEMLQMRVEPGMQFRLLGDDGNNYWATIKSPEEIAGLYDFELESSSSASNRSVQVDTAVQLYQATQNVLDIQLGLITPQERFEAIKNYYQAVGIKDWSRFVRKPDGVFRKLSPIEAANMVLAGIQVRPDPTQDLEGWLAQAEYIMKDDMILGQFNQDQVRMLQTWAQETAKMIEVLQATAAQNANVTQMQNNAQMNINQTTPNMGG